jgi:hypothetical protein
MLNFILLSVVILNVVAPLMCTVSLENCGINDGKSAASLCCQEAAWFPDMFCNSYLAKYHKFGKKNSISTKAREKISAG